MRKKTTILLALCLAVLQAHMQPLSFYHLTTANGLSDNRVQCVATDKNGFLWVGTNRGLNRYDGRQVTAYYQSSEPQLCNDFIAGLFCDSRNRIWVGTFTGVTMIDEQRRFHKILFNDSVKTNYSCAVIIETKKYGIIMYTSAGHYYLDESKNKWFPLQWSTKEQFRIGWRDNTIFNEDRYIQTGFDKLIILDYVAQKKSFEFSIPYAISACRVNDEEILVAAYKGKLVRISVSQKKIIKEYSLTRSQDGKMISANIVRIRQAANGAIMITTSTAGLFIFDPVTEKFSLYKHDVLDPASISESGKENLFCDATGNVFICSTSGGLDYFNIEYYSPGRITSFTAGSEIYDDRVNCISLDRKGRLWLGGQDCLLLHDPSTGKSAIYRYYDPVPGGGERPIEINCIGIDRQDRVWVGTNGAGIGMLNEATGQFRQFRADSLRGKKPGFVSNIIFDIIPGNEDTIWIGCSVGAVLFNTATYTTNRLKTVINDTGKDKAVIRIFKDSRGNTWLGTWDNGIYWYDAGHRLHEVKYSSGKKSTFVTGFAEDKKTRIYAAHSNGISAIDTGGKEIPFIPADGRDYKDCSSLLAAPGDQLWFCSNKTLSVLTTSTGIFHSFGNQVENRSYGFLSGAVSVNDSLQYWAAGKGIQFFDPAKLESRVPVLHPVVYAAATSDSVYSFGSSAPVRLQHKSNTISFFFTAPDLYRGENILYQYRLSGVDNEWNNSSGGRQARYNSLQPGTYTFQVRVSADGVNWVPSNTIAVRIRPALWQTGWFRALAVLLIAGIIIYFFRRRVAVIKEREKIRSQYERKIAEVEMASLRAQMNPHFMFNSLNSINNFILKNDPDNASGYLTKFSRLMRLILDNSRSEWVLLENELKALELYIQLEAVRFDDAFTYSITVAHDIDTETVTVPPLLIQPYVENAIWHGLLHRKEPGGRLGIQLWKSGDTLCIGIEDNGVGREEAKRLKSKTATRQKSHGMKITAERMDIVNKVYNVDAGVEITDLNAGPGHHGTRVLITLKYKTHDSHHSG